jgi:hypothetical protein
MADDISFDGVVRGLAKASDDMKREVGALIPVAAERMAATITARYPYGPLGQRSVKHMKDDVRIRSLSSADPLIPVRKVLAPNLAHIWQDGTVERFNITRGNARRGRMPAAAPGFFERTAVQTRAQMLQQAQAILDRPREIG